jgi:DNA-binding beta-propeller fold protein YncE
VTNTATQEIAAFTIGSGGQLTRITPNTGTGVGTAPIGITIDPTGQFLYVANSGMSEIAGFRIGAGGTLAATTPPTFSVLPNVPIGSQHRVVHSSLKLSYRV